MTLDRPDESLPSWGILDQVPVVAVTAKTNDRGLEASPLRHLRTWIPSFGWIQMDLLSLTSEVRRRPER
jgi:hypothetical protein